MENFKEIPSVDLLDFISGDPARKQKFVAQVGHAYENIGFMAVKNHGFGEQLEADLYKEVKNFFELPFDVKKKYEVPGISGQRGYTSFGKEHAKGRSVGDLKEFWHFGQDPHSEDAETASYPPNVPVAELEHFNKVGADTFIMMEKIGGTILKAIAIHLGLDENYFDAKIQNGNSILRPIHYGPITEEPKDAVRAAEHEDINLITLLMGASADGLEVLNKTNEWVAVTSLPGHLVVNVGDMLQRLTNNRLKSTTHRVVNPPREMWSQPRYSIPFFLHPRGSMPLNCLPSCITESNPIHYSDITAGEYLDERLIEIGLKKK